MEPLPVPPAPLFCQPVVVELVSATVSTAHAARSLVRQRTVALLSALFLLMSLAVVMASPGFATGRANGTPNPNATAHPSTNNSNAGGTNNSNANAGGSGSSNAGGIGNLNPSPSSTPNANPSPSGGNPNAGCHQQDEIVGGPFDATCTGSPSQNGNGANTNAPGPPCAGCVGHADNQQPPGQIGNTNSQGYECAGNNGVGQGNPAHTSCTTGTTDGCPDNPDRTEPPCTQESDGCPDNPDRTEPPCTQESDGCPDNPDRTEPPCSQEVTDNCPDNPDRTEPPCTTQNDDDDDVVVDDDDTTPPVVTDPGTGGSTPPVLTDPVDDGSTPPVVTGPEEGAPPVVTPPGSPEVPPSAPGSGRPPFVVNDAPPGTDDGGLPAQVLGVRFDRDASAPAVAPARVAAATDTDNETAASVLPFTGTGVIPFLIVGLASIAVGTALSKVRKPTH